MGSEWRDMMAAARLALTGRPAGAGERLRQALRMPLPQELRPSAAADLPGAATLGEATRAGREWLRRAMPGVPVPEAGMPQPAGSAAPQASAGPGAGRGEFLALTHEGPAGSRAYRLYVPAGVHPGPLPLVVMLHGCTQSPEDFATGTAMNRLADEHGVLVAYPAQTKAANGQKCWNWFRPVDQAREGGEPAIMAGIVADIAARHPVDRARVFAAGLSAGGAAAAVLARTHPELFAAVGVHSGLPACIARDVPSAMMAMRQGPGGRQASAAAAPVPMIVFHGDADSTVNPANGASFAANATGPGWHEEVERGQVPHGHAWTRTLHRDAQGRAMLERWVVHGAGHAWSGGDAGGTYTDPRGPDASEAMLRFFLAHPRAPGRPG